jgi:pyruvate dehydrogenase E2 component (dihydrolipoamide acetyltransferase)
LITSVVMPQMGLEVTEGTVAAIHVAPGAQVSEDDPLIEMETDKALTDVVAPRDGIVRSVDVKVGDTVEIGATLVTLADQGDEDLASAPDDVDAPPAAAPAHGASPAVAAASAPRGASRPADGEVRAAPVARRAALRLGVELADVEGTGPRGRVTLADVERVATEAGSATGPTSAVPTPTPVKATPSASGESFEPMSATRRAVARRMTLSQEIPQFSVEREIDATWLLGEKDRVAGAGDGDAKIGVSDLLLKAMAETVSRHPDLALSYVEAEDGGKPRLRRREAIDIGLAVATPRGLLVPVIRSVHERSLGQIAADRARLVDSARTGGLVGDEMGGAVITLSNLAGFGVDRFTAMVNPGESSILAVGRVVERVLPRGRGVAVVPTLALTMTIDHRVADGAAGGAALAELAELTEGGMTWRV